MHLYRIATCILILAMPRAFAETNAPKLELHIAIPELKDQEESRQVLTKHKLTLRNPCDLLSQYLTAGKGPGIAGAMEVARCDDDTNLAPPREGSGAINVTITAADAEKLVVSIYSNQKKSWSLYSRFDLKIANLARIVFSDEQSMSLLALRILDDLPFFGILLEDHGDIKNPIQVRPVAADIYLPQNIVAYELKTRKGVLTGKRVATFKLSESRDSYVFQALEKQEVQYPLFLHDAKGASNAGGRYLEKLNGRINKLESKNIVLDNFKSANVGFRYGSSISKESDPISKAPMYGIFSEFRGGILKGLRINYDTAPVATAEDDAIKKTMGWTRIQLGYAAIWSPKNMFITRFDIMPRIGLLRLKVDGYSKATDETESNQNFSFTSNAPSFSLELGLEKETKWTLIRAWMSQSVAISLLKTEKNQKTMSTKGGIDFYRDLFSIGKSSRFTGLLFAAAESTEISRDTSSVSTEVESSDIALSSIRFQKLWAGAGITLTWW